MEIPAQLRTDRAQHPPHNIFQKLVEYEREPAMGQALENGFGLALMTRVTSAAKGLATPILDEIQDIRGDGEGGIIATVKCVAHAEFVAAS